MTSPRSFPNRAIPAITATLLLLGLGGCSATPPREPAPPIFPVSGQVVLPGGKPFPGGVIHLVTRNYPTFAITGNIDSDGSFRVETIVEGQRLRGAPPGPCQVMLSPPLKGDLSGLKTYQPTRDQVVQEGENHFRIEVRSGNN
jgi:hypothetical protein